MSLVNLRRQAGSIVTWTPSALGVFQLGWHPPLTTSMLLNTTHQEEAISGSGIHGLISTLPLALQIRRDAGAEIDEAICLRAIAGS